MKKEIQNAVMLLMTEKSYMDITVTDIVNKAGVARASFYRNFDSIYDVVDSIAEKISDEMMEDVFPVISGTNERKWREFLFNHFYLFMKQHKQMEKLRFENLSVIFTELDKKTEQKASLLPVETINDKYTIVGKLGLINSVTKKWLDSGTKETPEEMINYIMSFITSF